MSDRLLICSALVPLAAGISALFFLQRVPGSQLAHAAAPISTPTAADAASGTSSGWIGVVVAGSSAQLAASAAGRVESVFVKTGQRVKRGDQLLQFDRSESVNSVGMASAQLSQRASELARSQARVQAARTRLSRLRAGQTWLSKQELDSAAAEVRVGEAELSAAQAGVGVSRAVLNQQRLSATRQTLVAPFDGTVVTLEVNRGDSVSAGQIVMRILSEDRQVRFAFPPGELKGERLSIRLAGGAQRVLSDVSAIRPEVDPSAQLVFATAPLPAALPDASAWIPGAAVQVSLAIEPQ